MSEYNQQNRDDWSRNKQHADVSLNLGIVFTGAQGK